jgi:hypothetical protein
MHSRQAPTGLGLARGLLAAIFSLFAAMPLWASRPTGPDVDGLAPRAGDELWVINSRAVACDDCLSRCPPDPDRLRAELYAPCQGWRRASVEAFLLSSAQESPAVEASDTVTVFYVTGNRDDVEETL